jgi:KDO2-lipid IV(A) lauroyltransferase
MNNLLIAFPEKTNEERIIIAKKFYHNLLDTFIETIKCFSMSDKQFSKRISGNFELLNQLYETGQSVHLHSGHFFNYEYMNWAVARNQKYTFLCVYMPITNKAFDKIMYDMRSRYKSVMLSAFTFKTTFHQYKDSMYALGLVADQSGHPSTSYWVELFGKLTPFVTGPEKSARLYNAAMVMVSMHKIKRGHYKMHFELLTTKPKEFQRGQLTKKYVAFLEEGIRKDPPNYLWSHRRWKWEFSEDYRKLVV